MNFVILYLYIHLKFKKYVHIALQTTYVNCSIPLCLIHGCFIQFFMFVHCWFFLIWYITSNNQSISQYAYCMYLLIRLVKQAVLRSCAVFQHTHMSYLWLHIYPVIVLSCVKKRLHYYCIFLATVIKPVFWSRWFQS